MSRSARGVARRPFARVALFLSPKYPKHAGLYLTPGYAVGSFTAPHSQSILLADLPTLHAKLASGKLKSLIRKRMSRINWKKVKRDMVRTELQIALESAQGQGAMVAKVKRYSGKVKAAEVAEAGLKALLNDKEVAKAALANNKELAKDMGRTIIADKEVARDMVETALADEEVVKAALANNKELARKIEAILKQASSRD
jgi:hypothetical protein